MAKFTTKDALLFLVAYVAAFVNTVLCDCNATSVTTISVYTTVSEFVSESTVTVTMFTHPIPPLPNSIGSPFPPYPALTLASPVGYPNVSTATETVTLGHGSALPTASVDNATSTEGIPTITLTSTALVTHTVFGNVSTTLQNATIPSSPGNTIASVPGSLTLTFPPVTAGPNCSSSAANTTVTETSVLTNVSTLFHPSSTATLSTVTPVPTGVFPTLSLITESVPFNGSFETSSEPGSVLTVTATATIFGNATTNTSIGLIQTVTPIDSVLSAAFSDLSVATSELANKTVTATVTSETVLPAMSVLSEALTSLQGTAAILPVVSVNASAIVTATTLVSTATQPAGLSMSTETEFVSALSTINQYNTSSTAPGKESTSLAQYTPSVTGGAAASIRVPRVFSLLTRVLALFGMSSVRASGVPVPVDTATDVPAAPATGVPYDTVTGELTTTWSTTTVTHTLTSHTTVPVAVNVTIASTESSSYTGPWNNSLPDLHNFTVTSVHTHTVFCNHTTHTVGEATEDSSFSCTCTSGPAFNYTSFPQTEGSNLTATANLTATPTLPAFGSFTPTTVIESTSTHQFSTTTLTTATETPTVASSASATASARRLALSTAVALMLVATVAWTVL